MDEIDILIIGAGVVGLAVAKQLAEKETNLVVVEKAKSFGQETSSRNSEVIHGGMYYPGQTLKAEMCVEGRQLLYEICQRHNIPYKKIGKLIVATEKEEIPSLEKLLIQGRDNGVDELRMINQQELGNLEPNVRGISAVYSRGTGIINSHRLMQYFLETVRSNSGIVSFNSEVTSIEKLSEGYKVVINCAGLDSDLIAQMAGIEIKQCKYELHYCKGEYFRVNSNKSGLIKRLIYLVPKPKSGGLGIHATLDLAGSLRLGPDDEYLEDRDKDYSVDNSKRTVFYESAKKFLPFLEEQDILPDTSGIRPKLQGKNEEFRDFVIKEESDKCLAGFINLIGIESPGLTASPAIAKMVSNMVRRYLAV